MNSILSTLPILLKITKGPPLKRWQPLCAAIKHPLGRAPVACQLLTSQSENWRWAMPWAMPHLVLPHEWCFCWSLNLGPFVDRQAFWVSLSCTHFLAFSSPLLSRGVISHMVANRSNNDQDKTGTQEWSAWIWKGVNCEHVTSGAKGASFGLVGSGCSAARGWGALAMSGRRDRRGFGRVKCVWKRSCWWSAELQQLPLKTNGGNKRERRERGHGSMMRGVQAPHFLSRCFNPSGDAGKKRENLARAHGSFRPPPTLLWPTWLEVQHPPVPSNSTTTTTHSLALYSA